MDCDFSIDYQLEKNILKVLIYSFLGAITFILILLTSVHWHKNQNLLVQRNIETLETLVLSFDRLLELNKNFDGKENEDDLY